MNLSAQVSSEPYAHESLSSYLRRMARRQFFADPIAFLRAGGVHWHDRSRDPDLLAGPLLDQVAAFFGLELDRVAMLTIHPYLGYLHDEDRGRMRWWIMLSRRTRLCDRCVGEQPCGRLDWRFPVITECLIHRRPLLDECRLCGAVRARSSGRWERFDCGHHARRSAGPDSRPVDLRVQQAIHVSLGLASAPPTRAGAWLIHAALAQHPGLLTVQLTREALRQRWVEQRRARAAWRRPAQVLRLLEQRGERMYPTRREPLAAAAPPDLVALSPEELRDTLARLGTQRRERPPSGSAAALATMTSPPDRQSVAW